MAVRARIQSYPSAAGAAPAGDSCGDSAAPPRLPGGAINPCGRIAPLDTTLTQAQGRRDAAGLPALLATGALVWTLAAWLSRGNLDVAGDMVENYAWGIEWQAGYSKHPPLFAWIVAAWFSVLPRTDLAYFALSALNVALGLLGVAALARRFLSERGAAFAALALAVSPLYTGLAIKFNANAVQLSLWPWTAFFFVAYMQTGARRFAAACGAFAALALLGKYFSVVLILALCLAAAAVPAFRQRLRGAGPWLAIAAGLLVLTPHLLWMFDHQFSTLRFASQRSAGELLPALLRLLNYTVAQVGYLLPSAVFLLWAVAPAQRRQAVRLMLRTPLRPSLHPPLWWLAFAPMIVVAALAVGLRAPMASVWGMAQWFAVTALWLAVFERHGIAPRWDWLRRALPVLWGLVIVGAVALGVHDARRGTALASEPRAELAQAVHRLWREQTQRPLVWVGGPQEQAASIVFYGPAGAHWWNLAAPAATPWFSDADLQRDGSVLVCPQADDACQRQAQDRATAPPVELVLHKRAWGIDLPAHRYSIDLILPK
jgi:Dolichyl-phosphate-mannose-protein mannosyltransferase